MFLSDNIISVLLFLSNNTTLVLLLLCVQNMRRFWAFEVASLSLTLTSFPVSLPVRHSHNPCQWISPRTFTQWWRHFKNYKSPDGELINVAHGANSVSKATSRTRTCKRPPWFSVGRVDITKNEACEWHMSTVVAKCHLDEDHHLSDDFSSIVERRTHTEKEITFISRHKIDFQRLYHKKLTLSENCQKIEILRKCIPRNWHSRKICCYINILRECIPRLMLSENMLLNRYFQRMFNKIEILRESVGRWILPENVPRVLKCNHLFFVPFFFFLLL